MLKKYAVIGVVFTGLLFAGTPVVNADGMSAINKRLGLVTQLMSILDKHPDLKALIEPLVIEHLNQLFADVDAEYKNRGQKVKATVNAKNVAKKELKKESKEKITWGDYTIEEITVERYTAIDKKWKVKIDFGDKKYEVIYVYEIDSEEELIESIIEKIKTQFGIEISMDDIESLLEINDNDADYSNDN